MTETFDLLIQNGSVFTPNGLESVDIGVREGKIAAIGKIGAEKAGIVMPATGLTVSCVFVVVSVRSMVPTGLLQIEHDYCK